MDITVVVDLDTDAVRRAVVEERRLQDLANDEYVNLFNSEPYEMRKRRWQEYLAASKELDELRGQENRTPEVRERERQLEQRVIPSNRFSIDPTSCLLRVRLPA